jgi:Flp pilus assembly protein TadD
LVATENAGTVRTDAFRQSVDKAGRDVCLMAARTAEKKKDYVEALRQYRKALEYDREDPNIMNSLASAYIRLGDYPAALDMADKALARVHDSISALINQGIARNGLGITSEARESFTTALALDPFNRTAMYNLALFHEKNGKLAEASTMFQRLARSGDVQGSMGLARIYEKQSRQAEAVKIYIDVAAKQDIPSVTRNSAVERLRQLGR